MCIVNWRSRAPELLAIVKIPQIPNKDTGSGILDPGGMRWFKSAEVTVDCKTNDRHRGNVAVIFFFHTTKGLTTIPDAPVARHARHETVQESEKV